MDVLRRPAKPRLLTTRSVVIVMIAAFIGAIACVLTYLSFHSLPQALLAGGAATGGCTGLLNQLLGTDPDSQASCRRDGQHDGHGELSD
jgi:hypothetical protein